ncbi:MAG: BlaI/MecI/CopY family transcriptional regulator [Alistipes sp.]|nr:BlaI/MecI/CopY family transcriptional regulator [Alistipes sp.]
MKALTKRENDVMEIFWRESDPLFMSEVVEEFAHQNLHFNTVATIVRGLEKKGFVGHETFGHSFRYFPVITKLEYSRGLLENIITKYYDHSYSRVVREFVENGKISAGQLNDLISNKERY